MKPGLANRLGGRFKKFTGVAFPTPLPHATLVGMPMKDEIAYLNRDAHRSARTWAWTRRSPPLS